MFPLFRPKNLWLYFFSAHLKKKKNDLFPSLPALPPKLSAGGQDGRGRSSPFYLSLGSGVDRSDLILADTILQAALASKRAHYYFVLVSSCLRILPSWANTNSHNNSAACPRRRGSLVASRCLCHVSWLSWVGETLAGPG